MNYFISAWSSVYWSICLINLYFISFMVSANQILMLTLKERKKERKEPFSIKNHLLHFEDLIGHLNFGRRWTFLCSILDPNLTFYRHPLVLGPFVSDPLRDMQRYICFSFLKISWCILGVAFAYIRANYCKCWDCPGIENGPSGPKSARTEPELIMGPYPDP